jgi:hypothetical protein
MFTIVARTNSQENGVSPKRERKKKKKKKIKRKEELARR